MALAFPQFARDEGLVCAVDDDGDSLVCWDSCPWNPMTVYASQLERVETLSLIHISEPTRPY